MENESNIPEEFTAPLETYCITFPYNSMRQNQYDTVQATSYMDAREKAYEKYKHEWSLVYTEAMFRVVNRRVQATLIISDKKK